MINAGFLLGQPVEFKKLCLIYPPKIKDVAANPHYGIYIRLLTYSQEEVEDEFVKNDLDLSQLLTPFEFLLSNAYNNQQVKAMIEEAFMFFIHESITFLFEQKQIIVGDISKASSIKDLRILNEADYFDFQNKIRESIGAKAVEPPNPNEDPRVKAIKAKARYRDQIKAKQGKNLKLETLITSICCMGFGLNPLNIGELSYAALPALLSTYQEKEKYELDVDSLLAGADSKKVKPKYWIRNLED